MLFLDDDVVPAPDLINEHLRWHAEHPNRVVLGTMITPPDVRLLPWVAWEQAMLEKQYRAMTSGIWPATARQFYTGNTSLSRQLILDVGGFDERFRRAEDIELAYRLAKLGVEFVFAPQQPATTTPSVALPRGWPHRTRMDVTTLFSVASSRLI